MEEVKIQIAFEDLPPLTEYCDCSEGLVFIGHHPDGDEIWGQCTLCRDVMKPTDFGKAVLELVRIYGGKNP